MVYYLDSDINGYDDEAVWSPIPLLRLANCLCFYLQASTVLAL